MGKLQKARGNKNKSNKIKVLHTISINYRGKSTNLTILTHNNKKKR